MQAQITLKSGSQITVDIDKIGAGRRNITKELAELSWETPEDWTSKLFHLDIDEIAAIVVLRTEEEAAVAPAAADAGQA